MVKLKIIEPKQLLKFLKEYLHLQELNKFL